MTAARRRKTSDAAGMAFEIKRKRHKQGDAFFHIAGLFVDCDRRKNLCRQETEDFIDRSGWMTSGTEET